MNSLQTLFVTAGILCLGWLFSTHSFDYDIEVVREFQAPPHVVSVSRDTPLVIPFEYPEKYLAGIVFYSADDKTAESIFDITLVDKKGHVIAEKTRQYTQYRKSGDPVISVLLSRHPSIKPGQAVSIRMAPRKPVSVALRANAPVNDAGVPMIVFSTLHNKSVSPGTRQGVIVGCALAFAMLLLWIAREVRIKHQWIIASLVIVLCGFLVTLPYTYRPSAWGIKDWDYHHSLSHIYQQTIRTYGEIPFWNPYFCGGTAIWGDPEISIFTPFFVLQYIFGVETGAGLALLLSFVLTGLGVMVLGKYIGLSPFEATLSSVIVLCSSVLVLKASEGHTPIIFAYMWVPWILWAWLQKKSLLCGAFLSLVVLQGGIYVLSYVAVSFVLLTLLRKNKKESFHVSLFAGVWMVGLSGFQLIPTLYWLTEYQDEAFVSSTYTLNHLSDIFFGRYMQHTFILKDQLSDWHEYGAYIGYGVLVLAVLGVSYVRSRRVVFAIAVGAITTLVFSSLGPLLQNVFAFLPFIPRSNISRLVLFTLLCASLLAGFGMKKLIRISSRVWMIPLLVTSFICIDLSSLAYPIAEQGFSLPRVMSTSHVSATPISYTLEDYTVRQQGLDMPRSYGATLQGYGTFTFCSALGPHSAVAAITAEDPEPNYITSYPAVDTELLHWSPNRVVLRVQASQRSVLTINANYAPGWNTDYGVIQRDTGRLTIEVPEGSREMTVWYSPPGIALGIVVTVIAGICAVASKRRYWVRKKTC